MLSKYFIAYRSFDQKGDAGTGNFTVDLEEINSIDDIRVIEQLIVDQSPHKLTGATIINIIKLPI